MANKLKLTLAIADYPHVAALKDGSIPIEGIEPVFIKVVPQIAAFRRMVRNLEFDVCELAATSYIIARAHSARFVALPIFVMRRFHHSGLLVRPDGGITHPKHLEGKKVGVRAYSVTTGVWTRSILIDDYALNISKVSWIVDDEEHVTQLKLPHNVQQAPPGQSLISMMASGEISAGFAGNAGLSRAGTPTAEWDRTGPNAPTYPELFPNAPELEQEWHKRSGIYPIHGTIVVKEAILKEHPWVARSLLIAFQEAKSEWLLQLKRGVGQTADDVKYRSLMSIVGDDPLPYGLAKNMRTIQALEDTAFKQGLIPRRMSTAELFIDP